MYDLGRKDLAEKRDARTLYIFFRTYGLSSIQVRSCREMQP